MLGRTKNEYGKFEKRADTHSGWAEEGTSSFFNWDGSPSVTHTKYACSTEVGLCTRSVSGVPSRFSENICKANSNNSRGEGSMLIEERA